MAEMFQHTAARRRLGLPCGLPFALGLFQHTAARRRLVNSSRAVTLPPIVSTHSRPKAAGATRIIEEYLHGFQHTAARRRLGTK